MKILKKELPTRIWLKVRRRKHSAVIGSVSGKTISASTLASDNKSIFRILMCSLFHSANVGRKSGQSLRTDVTADFQRLNILLLRAVTGRMIGTALLTEARIHVVHCTECVSASGSLGGLQVHSLLPGVSQLHQRIISVGNDPTVKQEKAETSIHASLYQKDSQPEDMAKRDQAFSFTINYRNKGTF